MTIRPFAYSALSLLAALSVASIADARTMPHTLRAGTFAPASNLVGTSFTNQAGDITVAPPKGWTSSESETWSKSSDGTEDYSESVSMNSPNSMVSIQISANAAGSDTLATKMHDLESTYQDSKIISEGTTTIGSDVGYAIESVDSYSHVKEVVVIKNGWEYDLYVSVDPHSWSKYTKAIAASISTFKINLVK